LFYDRIKIVKFFHFFFDITIVASNYKLKMGLIRNT
jgi:hypothetical protein